MGSVPPGGEGGGGDPGGVTTFSSRPWGEGYRHFPLGSLWTFSPVTPSSLVWGLVSKAGSGCLNSSGTISSRGRAPHLDIVSC